ncbi:hypothetical protein KAW64_11905 [bacterium]|nr:hypothetical protein [bacterium]
MNGVVADAMDARLDAMRWDIRIQGMVDALDGDGCSPEVLDHVLEVVTEARNNTDDRRRV